MAPNTDYDIQILSKRYENEHPVTQGKFVRKIYIGKGKFSKHLESCCNLAVITYFWKGEPIDFEVDEPARPSVPLKRRYGAGQSNLVAGAAMGGLKVRRADTGFERIEEGVTPIYEDEMESPGANVTLDCGPTTTATSSMVNRRLAGIQSAARRTFFHSSGASPVKPSTPLGGLVLSHADHVKRMTLAKELENQTRLSALLERAEQFLDRFEQAGAAMGVVAPSSQQFVGEDGSIWEAQVPPHGHGAQPQMVVEDQVIVQDDVGQYVTPDGQPIVVPTGYSVQNVEY